MTRKSTGNQFSKHVARRHDASGLRTGLKNTVKRGYSGLATHASTPGLAPMRSEIANQRESINHKAHSLATDCSATLIENPKFLADSGLLEQRI